MTANFHLRINRAIFKALVLTLFCTGLFNLAQAESRDQAIAVDYLQGEGDVQGLKLAYQHHVDWLSGLDPRLTARALQNLLRNAMRYCEKRIQIGVQVQPEGCEIWVDDDGIGAAGQRLGKTLGPVTRHEEVAAGQAAHLSTARPFRRY